ncbi:Plasmid SOS inhibition [Salmonella enterica subsp. enterica serovar Pullorum]|nr:Plasmid SOS inhibition [Salmonella enterica subsp. enterica serovar Pullorum]
MPGIRAGLTSLTRGSWRRGSGSGGRGFTSLTSLDWLRDSDEPLYNVMYEIWFIVRENPVYVREAERWQVPKQADEPEARATSLIKPVWKRRPPG